MSEERGAKSKPLHHGVVEAIGGVGEDKDQHIEVQAAHVTLLPPLDAREDPPGHQEVALGRLD
jgi:hypothetical protein